MMIEGIIEFFILKNLSANDWQRGFCLHEKGRLRYFPDKRHIYYLVKYVSKKEINICKKI